MPHVRGTVLDALRRARCHLDDLDGFGVINSHFAGFDYRYPYAATGQPGWFLFDGLLKQDVKTGAEDDGYLITLTTDMNTDAARVGDGPVCTLALPERISSGTHSTWAPGAELRRWRERDSAAQAIGL